MEKLFVLSSQKTIALDLAECGVEHRPFTSVVGWFFILTFVLLFAGVSAHDHGRLPSRAPVLGATRVSFGGELFA